MYLVEYVKIIKKQNKKCYSCFDSKDEAVKFFYDLVYCSNIEHAELSAINYTKTEIFYQKK